jgi:hypothetical protein
MLRHQDSEGNSSYLEPCRWVGKARNFNSSDGKSRVKNRIYFGIQEHKTLSISCSSRNLAVSSHTRSKLSACNMEQILV